MRRSLRSLIDAMDFAGNLVEGTNHLYRDHNLENTGFNNCYSSFSTINYQSMKSLAYLSICLPKESLVRRSSCLCLLPISSICLAYCSPLWQSPYLCTCCLCEFCFSLHSNVHFQLNFLRKRTGEPGENGRIY